MVDGNIVRITLRVETFEEVTHQCVDIDRDVLKEAYVPGAIWESVLGQLKRECEGAPQIKRLFRMKTAHEAATGAITDTRPDLPVFMLPDEPEVIAAQESKIAY